MSIYATTQEVQELKERALQWQSEGYPGADPLMPAVLDLILQLPDIAPVWSCEGHAPESQKDLKRRKEFYIMFAVTSSGWYTLTELYEEVRKRLMPYQNAYDEYVAKAREEKGKEAVIDVSSTPHSNVPSLGMVITTRVWPGTVADNGGFRWYNVVNFNASTSFEGSKDIFFTALMGALNQMVDLRKEVVYENVRIHRINAETGEDLLRWPEHLVRKAVESFNQRRTFQTGEYGYRFDFATPNVEARHLSVNEDKSSHAVSNMRVVDNWVVVDIRVLRRHPYGDILYKVIGDKYPQYTDPQETDLPAYFKLRFVAAGVGGKDAEKLAFITADFVNKPPKKGK